MRTTKTNGGRSLHYSWTPVHGRQADAFNFIWSCCARRGYFKTKL